MSKKRSIKAECRRRRLIHERHTRDLNRTIQTLGWELDAALAENQTLREMLSKRMRDGGEGFTRPALPPTGSQGSDLPDPSQDARPGTGRRLPP